MKKINSISKELMILGLVSVCVILIIGLFMRTQIPKNGDALPNMDNAVQNVTTDDIAETPTAVPIPVIQPDKIIVPDEAPADEPPEIYIMELEENVTALTVMPEKPEPPELPETAYRERPTGDATIEDVEAHKALDPALTNPDVKPDGTPVTKPAENTTQPANNTPQGEPVIGEQRYFPGFGWITYTGPNIGERSTSTGDWNKIIGSFN